MDQFFLSSPDQLNLGSGVSFVVWDAEVRSGDYCGGSQVRRADAKDFQVLKQRFESNGLDFFSRPLVALVQRHVCSRLRADLYVTC